MGQDTKIQWCHHTFNPWRGCVKVSDGCKNCYAEVQARRNPAVLGEWGPGSKRAIAAESYWQQPIRWDRAAEKAGERRRVFCASFADVFEDRPDLIQPRWRLMDLARSTRHLDLLFLTKRIENVRRMLADRACYDGVDWLESPQPNVWLGTTVENQQRADERIPILRDIPAAVRFLSIEPMLGPIDLRKGIYAMPPDGRLRGTSLHADLSGSIDWVICGGESGRNARPFDLAWARGLRDQCKAAGVAFFLKQLGARPFYLDGTPGPEKVWPELRLRDSHGGDPDEWPDDLRDCREFPRVGTTIGGAR